MKCKAGILQRKYFSVFLKTRMHSTITISRVPLCCRRIQMQTIAFYLLSQTRILNHISISLPLSSQTYIPIYIRISLPPSLFLSLIPSSQRTGNSPGDSPCKILMCSVKCCCLECCPDHELCSWTEEKAKQPFRLRQRSMQLDVAARTTPSRASLYPPLLSSMQMSHDRNVKPN